MICTVVPDTHEKGHAGLVGTRQHSRYKVHNFIELEITTRRNAARRQRGRQTRQQQPIYPNAKQGYLIKADRKGGEEPHKKGMKVETETKANNMRADKNRPPKRAQACCLYVCSRGVVPLRSLFGRPALRYKSAFLTTPNRTPRVNRLRNVIYPTLKPCGAALSLPS